MPLPQALFDEVTASLTEFGRPDLVKKLRMNRSRDLTSTEAAELLGVSSANTVKNWLRGGHFPEAYKTKGGHWRFPKAGVLAARTAMEELERRNRENDLAPSDADDDEPIPLL
ncbi:MAG: helix-turn-helix domain-containing protein [Deltaproteobacteria bacterium]|nr:helix-turn-helix domain-containing protein [Deltaproteobacteria bacterium]